MEYKPLSGREFPRFSGIKTFFRLPVAPLDADYDVGLFGIPFDGGTSYRPGARFAPAGVREASSLGRGFHAYHGVSFVESLKVADLGDCPTVPIDQQQTYSRIEKFVGELVGKGKKFVAVGGDHSITLPILRVLHRHFKKKISLIHFDAHLDTYPAAWGCEYHHGTFARHGIEEGLIDPKKSVQIGIRGPYVAGEDLEFARKHGLTAWTIDDIRYKGVKELTKSWPDFGDSPVYISFDVDCLDPAFAPGTGTPVPGGMTTWEAQQIFRFLPKKLNLVGADVVEVLPAFDPSTITQLAAVDVMFECLSTMARQV